MAYEILDEAYDRLRSTGPEFEGWLSNHGPMAAEALARHGHAQALPGWLDRYCRRLESAPGGAHRIVDWREALGDPRRLGDWLAFFDDQTREQPWTELLETWWPRLLPGIAAGATHGVIRTGHAVRVLREEGETPPRLAELAQALGYWAARWQSVPAAAAPSGELDIASAVAALPVIPHQTGDIRSRFAQLAHLNGWEKSQRALKPVDDGEEFLRQVVIAAVRRYATHAHGNPVMLVHAATAPNAVLRVLPSLPPHLRRASAEAAWSASAAVQAAYAPTTARPQATREGGPVEYFHRAAEHGDEHVIKLADTALDVYAWDQDETALAAITAATELIDPLR